MSDFSAGLATQRITKSLPLIITPLKNARKIRIGLVGAGTVVRQRHLPNLREIPGVEIVAVCNSRFESSRRFCEQHAPHATPIKNWPDLLALPDLDVIWIGTPPHLHATIAVSALEANRHVFCQARMAANLPEAEEMLAASQHSPHLVTMVCPPPHGMLGDLAMRKLLASETIGQPHQIRLHSFTSQWLDPEAPAHWRQRAELSGINILTLGIYVEVLQRWLGPIDEVAAKAKTVFPLRQGYAIDIPDLLHVLCRFAGGAEGVLEFSGVAAFAPSDRLEIYGNRGTISYDFSNDSIQLGHLDSPAMENYEITQEFQTPWNVEETFISAIRNPGSLKPRPTFAEGVAYMRVVDAVARSLASGTAERV